MFLGELEAHLIQPAILLGKVSLLLNLEPDKLGPHLLDFFAELVHLQHAQLQSLRLAHMILLTT